MSSRSPNSLIDLKPNNQLCSRQEILHLFSTVQKNAKPDPAQNLGRTAALVFLEASTRTRLSFETACVRLGLHPLIVSGKSGTSLEKGETGRDTIHNVAAMNPAVVIVRSGDDLDQEKIADEIQMPLLNAGWGKKGHPTQALLDAYTIWNRRGRIEGEKILIVGDVRHSRVASSHFELAQILGYEIALCGPEEYLPETAGFKTFADLREGLQWSTSVMALRVQTERHAGGAKMGRDYAEIYGLNLRSLPLLKKDHLILHPGPVNYGVEIDEAAYRDSRSVILEQVTNGVGIRQALVARALEGGKR